MIPHSEGLTSVAPVHHLPKVFPPFDGHWHFKSNDVYRPFLTSGVISTPGTRGADRMEDSHFLAESVGGCSDLHVYGVFDGHGGSGASKYAEKNFLRHLGQAWCAQGFKVENLPEALRDAFVNLVRPTPHSTTKRPNSIAQQVPPRRMPSSCTRTWKIIAVRRPSCVLWRAASLWWQTRVTVEL
jgi:hypothetical protein